MIHRTLNRDIYQQLMDQNPALKRTTEKYERTFHPIRPLTSDRLSPAAKVINTVRSIALFVFTLGIYHYQARSLAHHGWQTVVCMNASSTAKAAQKKDEEIQNLNGQIETLKGQLQGSKHEYTELEKLASQNKLRLDHEANKNVQSLSNEKARLEEKIKELENRLDNSHKNGQKIINEKAVQIIGLRNDLGLKDQEIQRLTQLMKTLETQSTQSRENALNIILRREHEIQNLKQQVKEIKAQLEKAHPSQPDDPEPPQERPPAFVFVYADANAAAIAKRREAELAAWKQQLEELQAWVKQMQDQRAQKAQQQANKMKDQTFLKELEGAKLDLLFLQSQLQALLKLNPEDRLEFQGQQMTASECKTKMIALCQATEQKYSHIQSEYQLWKEETLVQSAPQRRLAYA